MSRRQIRRLFAFIQFHPPDEAMRRDLAQYGYDTNTDENNPAHINVLLHVKDGKLSMLEIFKDDSSRILKKPADANKFDLFSRNKAKWTSRASQSTRDTNEDETLGQLLAYERILNAKQSSTASN